MTSRRQTNAYGNLPRANAEAAAIMFGAPFVIASRMTQFWLAAAAPTAKDRKEASDMVSEKMIAAQESLMAMNLAATKAVVAASTTMLTGGRTNDPMDTILAAGLKPYSRQVKANRKRLSKTS